MLSHEYAYVSPSHGLVSNMYAIPGFWLAMPVAMQSALWGSTERVALSVSKREV